MLSKKSFLKISRTKCRQSFLKRSRTKCQQNTCVDFRRKWRPRLVHLDWCKHLAACKTKKIFMREATMGLAGEHEPFPDRTRYLYNALDFSQWMFARSLEHKTGKEADKNTLDWRDFTKHKVVDGEHALPATLNINR